MKLLRQVDKAFDRFIDAMAAFSGILIVAIMLIVCTSVTMRYFFHDPFGWTDEVAGYAQVYAIFLVCAWVLKEEAHIVVDVVTSHLNPKLQTLIKCISFAIGAILCFILAWYGFKVAVDQYQAHTFTVTLMELPQWIFTWIIGFGFLLMAIVSTKKFYFYLGKWKSPKVEKAEKVAEPTVSTPISGI